MEKKKFGIKIRLVYELNNFPKIDLPGPCCPSLCMTMYYFAHQRWCVGRTRNARRQWKRREKTGPHHFNGTSKQNTDACLQLPWCTREGGSWGSCGGTCPGTALPCSMAFHIQLATVTTYFWWHRKRTDLLWFGSNTITQVILK